jgi:energy-coupling factor transport system substrate-specific component
LLLIAMIAACGTAVKVIVGVLVRTLTTSIGIPGGAIAVGFYMLWLALGVGLIKKFGTATFISLIQSLMVFLGGLPGSHGIVTFLTYMGPAILVDIVFIFSKNKNYNILHYLIATMLANIAGTYGTNLVFF